MQSLTKKLLPCSVCAMGSHKGNWNWEQCLNWKCPGWTQNPQNVKERVCQTAYSASHSKWTFSSMLKRFTANGMRAWDGCYRWIMHVFPSVSCYCSLMFHSFRGCARHLQPNHSSSPHSLQLGLWVHQATLRPWKKQEPQLHRVHPVSAGICFN